MSKWWLKCEHCQTKEGMHRLFDFLSDISKKKRFKCRNCHNPRIPFLKFKFGLDAGERTCKVLAAFLPDKIQRWKDEDGIWVSFYPFLVILKSGKNRQHIWLPYWHVKKKDDRRPYKYGQWAPFMDVGLFKSLLEKARQEYLSG